MGKNEYYLKIGDINVSDFHIVLIFSNILMCPIFISYSFLINTIHKSQLFLTK